MTTVGDTIDLCQRYLRDREGVLWPRTELLRHMNDGYRRLLAESQGVRRLTILAVPPRYAFAGTQHWEQRHAQGGAFRPWTYSSAASTYQSTALWAVEHHAGIAAPADQRATVTQLWELGYATGEVDADYRFALPRAHERIKALYFDHRPISPLSTRELDALETAWNRAQGEPWAWVPGYGETRSFEVYHIRTPYSDDYAMRSDTCYGIPRTISGARTYATTGTTLAHRYAYTTQADALHHQRRRGSALQGWGLRITQDPAPNPGRQYQATQVWEQERHTGATTFTAGITVGTAAWESAYGAANMGTVALGLLRTVQSPERQYLPAVDWTEPYGTIRAWASSEGNLLLHEVVIPDVPSLTEEDVPPMIPAQLMKYLRMYVLSCAFAKMGPGFRVDLAVHWQVRYERGIALLRKLGDLTYADMHYQREATRPDREGRLSGRVPLGPEYGNVRG